MAGRHNHDVEIRKIVQQEFKMALLSAVNGDIEFKITPEAVDTIDDLQNVGEHQEIKATIAGSVTDAGGEDMTVRVKAKVLDGGEFELTDVTLAHTENQDAIAAAIVAALNGTTQFSADGNTGVIQVTASDAVITLKMVDEAAHDETFTLEVEEGAVTFEALDPLGVTVETEQEGVAPYTRNVIVELVDSYGNRHWWFTGTVPVTIGEVTDGDGAAEVVGGLSPTMTNGRMVVKVLLRGDWSGADSDTNTLSVTQATILGATVTAVTSEETSIEVPAED